MEAPRSEVRNEQEKPRTLSSVKRWSHEGTEAKKGRDNIKANLKRLPLPKPSIKKNNKGLGVVAPTCNPSSQEADAGRLRVQDQPRLCNKNLSQKTPKKNNVGLTLV
jgi:hypothetical protein